MNQEEQTDYRQQLGLKKILYKYQNENQQLRSQIKALNERLEWILNKPKTPQQKIKIDPIQQYQGQILKQQMAKLYKEINQQSIQMKINKQSIDERHELKCLEIQNKIVKEEKEISELQYKLLKYEQIDDAIKIHQPGANFQQSTYKNYPSNSTNNQSKNVSAKNLNNNNIDLLLQSNNKTVRSSTVRVQNYLQKLNVIKEETENLRKNIKDLEHQRDINERNLIKKHQYQTDFAINNRSLQSSHNKIEEQTPQNSKKKGIWAMQNTKQNYDFIKLELEKLKKQMDTGLQTIRNENIVLSNKLAQLQNELQGLNNAVEIPPIPYQKRPLKIPIDLSISTKIETPLLQKKSLKPIDMTPIDFQRKNDKNFAPKLSRKIQWQSTKNNSGIQWNDSNSRSLIIGLNLWFDGPLLGVQILHEFGSSGQQMQVLGGKKMIPIQYRLSAGDYLQNVILYIVDGLIHGVEFMSKNGRVDKFGLSSKGKKFDFGIKKPQKPIVSFGQYRINNNVSEITKLGFEVI